MGDMSANTPWRRRLVICCDGTWQSSVSTDDNVPSNVTRLCRVIARIGTEPNEPTKKWHQLVYYDSGVGTGNLSDTEKSRQGGTGAGLAENVIEAYNFIVLNYEPGDEIFCFGFSRGAYTARAVAGLVTDIGIIKPVDMQIFPRIYRSYMTNDEGMPFRKTDAWKGFVKEFEVSGSPLPPEESRVVKVVGVWDTVGSLGIPDIAFFDNSNMRTKYGFHNVKLNENIRHAFHALALDERRAAFRPTLWYISKELQERFKGNEDKLPELKQVWFPGVHINCGGGSDDSITEMKGDLEQMSTATFVWMLQVISPYLTIDQSAFKIQMRQYQHWLENIRSACTYHHAGFKDWIASKTPTIPFINPAVDPLAPPKRAPKHTHHFDYGWGVGPIVDSVTGIFKLSSTLSRIPGSCQTETYTENPMLFGLWKNKKYKLEDMDTYGATNEYIHPICAYRKIVRDKKDISALKDFKREYEPTNGKGRFWWQIKGSKKPALPEWVILEHSTHLRELGANDIGEVNFERAWYEQCLEIQGRDRAMEISTLLKQSDLSCVKDFLDHLDDQNDFRVGEKKPWVYP